MPNTHTQTAPLSRIPKDKMSHIPVDEIPLVERIQRVRRVEQPRAVSTMGKIRALFSCIRAREVALLQGPPLMGIAFSKHRFSFADAGVISIFVLAGFLLVAHIWSLNDWADLRADEEHEGKSSRVFSSKGVTPPAMLRFSLSLLAVAMALFLALKWETALIAATIASFGVLYSLPGLGAKGRPFFSSLLHLLGGTLHFLLGYTLFSGVTAPAVAIAGFFALVFTAGHAVQEVQDYEGDRARGVRTNAVVFGKRIVFLAALAGFAMAYTLLAKLAFDEVIPAPLMWVSVVGLPLQLYLACRTLSAGLKPESVRLFRNCYRFIFAGIGICMVAALF